ncbi:MAG: hypothetical protein LBL81_00180, partial [Tannerella sp.]|nr:hypothetical protein [Tannerella sp.]
VFFNFGREEQVTRGAASLAPDGSFRIRFRPEKPANAGASCFESYRLLASLTDSKGETQETQLFFSAGERSLFLQCHVNGTFNKEADSLCIQARTSKGATASVKGHYAIYRLPSEAPEAAPQGRPFLEGDFSAGKPLPRKLTAALPSAPLLLRMEANDDQGRPVSDSCRFTAFSYADKRPPIQTPIWLPAPEQPDCLPGEEAVFLFGTSEKKAYVLCQFFGNGKAVATQRIVLKRENRLLRLPFKEDYADLSARFTFIKEGKVYSRQTQVGKRQPKKEIRFVPLSFRDMLQPGEKESWQFRLSDAAARPVKAEVLASMYDASLDALQPFRWNFSPFEKPLPRYIPPFREEAGMGEDYSQDVWQEALVQTAPIGFADIDWQGLFGLIRSPLYYGTMQTPFPESVYMRKNAILADEAVSPNTDSAPAKMPETLPQWRQNFNETAFFFPELHTDTAGTLRIDFTLPDSNTRWKLQVLAHTRDLNYGLYTAEAVSQKPLMLIPNLPRFLRRGDTASVSVQIANQTEATLSGRLRFELFDPDNGEIFFADSTQSFRVAARGMAKASWNFPVRMGGTEVGCRLLASTPQGSDGEQDLLPLLPDRLPMTDALPFYLGNDSASLLLRPKPHPGSRYTLEYTANALWAAAETLPFLFKADTHNQDLLSVFASYYSAAIASFLYETIPEIRGIKGFAYLSDKNRMAERRTFFLERLQKTQNPDGGWGWCEGMRSDRGVTLYLLEGMARLRRLALDDSGREYTQKAVGFLDAAFRKDAAELSDKKNYVPSARQIRMLYVRSLYRDLPETADTRRATRYFSTQAGRYWQKTSLAGKVQTALLMQADGDKETAAAILAWLRRTATISPEQGMYWANNRREGSGLLSPIGLHCLIMEAFRSLGGTEKETDRMRQWLLVQKRVQAWESVPATADALYALLRSGSSWTGLLKAPSLQWNGRPLKAVEGEAGSGHFRQKLPPTTGGHPSLLLHKTGTAPAWGALLTTYTLPMQEATAQKGALHLERQYFIETNDGRQRLLRPLEEGQALHVGEKVVIRLVIRSDREMDYVRLEDLRPAGLEPLKQISGMERSGSLLYYHSPQDEAELFYFDRLPQGTYVLEYATYVSRPGSYAVGPATLQCLYAPEFLSRTVGKELKVIP